LGKERKLTQRQCLWEQTRRAVDAKTDLLLALLLSTTAEGAPTPLSSSSNHDNYNNYCNYHYNKKRVEADFTGQAGELAGNTARGPPR